MGSPPHSSPPARAGLSVVLVGMMGVGKTTVGRRLAPRLGLPFFDADEEIVRAAGMSVAELFKAHGEDSFRRGEAQVIERLLSGPAIVLATGGGAMINENTRRLVKQRSTSIWLQADLDTLVERASRRRTRPLLKTADPRATLERLLNERTPFYAEANIAVDATPGPHERTVEAIVKALTAFASGEAPARDPGAFAAASEPRS